MPVPETLLFWAWLGYFLKLYVSYTSKWSKLYFDCSEVSYLMHIFCSCPFCSCLYQCPLSPFYDVFKSVEKFSRILQRSLPCYLIYFHFPTFCIEWQLLAGMIAEPAFLSEYTIFALDPTKQPKPQSDGVVSPPTPP